MADLGPARRIELRGPDGRSAGYFTTRKSDAEIAADNRAIARHRAEVLRTSLAATLPAQRQREAEHLAQDLARFRERWGDDPRQALRAAHQRLAAARDALTRRQEVAAAAREHVRECQRAYASAKAALEEIVARAAAELKAGLERGEAPRPRAAQQQGAEVEIAESARQALRLAERAQAELADLVGPAEATVRAAELAVKHSARALIQVEQKRLRAEDARLEERRQAIHSLLAELAGALQDRNWEIRWAPDLEQLLRDPEAELVMA